MMLTALAVLAAVQTGAADIRRGTAVAIAVDGTTPTCLCVERRWSGPVLATRVNSRCKAAVAIREVVALQGKHNLPPQTGLYGEGFTMLSLAVGTIGKPEHLVRQDAVHHRIPQPAGSQTYHGATLLSPLRADHLLIGCKPSTGELLTGAGVRIVYSLDRRLSGEPSL